MEPMNLPGKDRVVGMDQRCKPLPIRDLVDDAGNAVMQTLWMPTDLERGLVLTGYPVVLNIRGDVHPFVSLFVDEETMVRTNAPAHVLGFSYRNYRGELSYRRVDPVCFWYGHTAWHKEDQWLLRALDHEKGDVRDFAVKDIRSDENVSRKAEAWIKRVMPLLDRLAGDGVFVEGLDDPTELWNDGYGLFELPAVVTLQADPNQAVQTAALRPEADADRLREILHDLVLQLAEEKAIGGGPGFKGRHARTLEQAHEILGLEV